MGSRSSTSKYDLFRYKVAQQILGPEEINRLERYYDKVATHGVRVNNPQVLDLSMFLSITAGSIVPVDFVKNLFYMF